MECKRCSREYNERNYIACPRCYEHDARLKSAYYETVENMPIHASAILAVASFYYRNRHRAVNYKEAEGLTVSCIADCRDRLRATYGWVFKRHGRKGYQLIDINVPERA